ncbi:hypothetical protein LINPERHAP1_LOCUS3029 [Linum perenne]
MFNILVLNPRMIVMYPSGTYTLNSILIKFPSMGLTHQIPVIDMIKLAGGGGDDADEESAKLHSACKDWGFFQGSRRKQESRIRSKIDRNPPDGDTHGERYGSGDPIPNALIVRRYLVTTVPVRI